jgi:hypothetical protein
MSGSRVYQSGFAAESIIVKHTCQFEQARQVESLHARHREAKHGASILVGLLDVAVAVHFHDGIQDVSAPDVKGVHSVLHMSCSQMTTARALH